MPDARGYLPHRDGTGESTFVTLRLADSLPEALLRMLPRRLDPRVSRRRSEEIDRCRQAMVNGILDRGLGACWLSHPDVAAIVAESIIWGEGRRYRLGEWVLMPNHVHLLLRPIEGHSVGQVIGRMKSFTALRANEILGRTGAFWQKDYFDRRVRDDDSLERVGNYIRCNPVKAGLCRSPTEWRWSSAYRPANPTDPAQNAHGLGTDEGVGR